MEIVSYTNTDAIRAALGVTANELYDNQISDLEVADLILLELASVYPDHQALHTAVIANTATPEQQETYLILKQYCKYEGACFMLPQMQMLFPQKVSDGDITNTRFQANNLEEISSKIMAMRDKYKHMLNPSLIPDGPGVPIIGLIIPSYNPVTNEGG